MDDELDLIAAEYVLGTLDEQERTRATARAATDADFARAIRDWERRLAPLNAGYAEVRPQPQVFERILARTSAGARLVDLEDRVAAIARSRNLWRSLAAASMAAAATLVVGFAVREAWWQSQPSTFVAILQKDAASPAFLLSIDTREKSLVVRPVNAAPTADKSYELWLVHDTLATPKSLGLISDTTTVSNKALREIDESVLRGATYAVSLEPKGGSTTGAPTGPVLFASKLIPSGI